MCPALSFQKANYVGKTVKDVWWEGHGDLERSFASNLKFDGPELTLVFKVRQQERPAKHHEMSYRLQDRHRVPLVFVWLHTFLTLNPEMRHHCH